MYCKLIRILYNSTVTVAASGMGQLKSTSTRISRPSDYTEELWDFYNGADGCRPYERGSTSFSIKNYSLVRKATLVIHRDDYANITLNGHSIMSEVDESTHNCRNHAHGTYDYEFNVTNYVRASGNTLTFCLERFNQSSFNASIRIEY